MTMTNVKLNGNGQTQTAQPMQASLQLLPLIMNNIPQSVFWKDSDLVYLGCNQAFAKDAGFSSPEEIVGKTDFDMPWRDQAELYRSDDFQVMEKGESKLNYEEPQTTPQGSTIWLRTSKIPVYENGQTIAVLGMYEDITQHKIAEEQIKEERQRFQIILETIRVPTIISRLSDGLVLYANQAISQVSQVDLDKLIGFKTSNFYVNADDQKKVKETLRQDGYIDDFEVQFQRTDGSTYWALLSSRIITYQDETCVLSSYIDITGRKQAEQALKDEEQRLQTILGSISVPIIISRLSDSKVLYANEALAEVGHIDLDMLIGGRTVDYFANTEDRNKVAEMLRQQGRVSGFETQLRRGDGVLYWALLSAHVVTYQNDLCVFTSYTDITTFKVMEQQIQTAFERRGRQVQLSTQVSQSIAAATSLEDLYQRVVNQVREQFGYYHTQLLRYEPTQEAIVLVTGYGETGAKMLAEEHHLPMGKGLIGTAAATGETVLRPALQNDPDWRPNPLLPETKGEIAVPIKLGNTILGVLDVQSNLIDALDTDDQLLLEGLCGQIAIAIESTRLNQEMTERLEEINRLYRAMSHEGWQTYRETANIPAGYMFDQGGLRQVQETPLADEHFSNVPLTAPGGEVIGTLAMENDPQHPISPEDQIFLEQVSEQVALALESARLFEQTQSALATTQESEERLSEALDIARLANWEYDVEKDLFTFNDHFYSIFHTTAEKVGGYLLSSGDYARLFVHPEDVPVVGTEIGKALASTDRHYSAKLEHRIIYADGQVGYIAVDIHIERDENGKITRYYGANQDITERKRAEEILRVSEGRLSEALNIAKLANWEYDVEKDLFTFNDHFYSIFHTTAEQVGGYQLSSADYARLFVHPDDIPVVGTEIGKALASTDRHYSAKLEHRILFRDGGMGYISVDIHIERDENGKITRYFGANQDITERKQAEEAVKAEQQRVQLILESVTIPMVITRLSDNHLTFVNSPALEVTQFKYEDVINQPSPDFYVNADDRKNFITELRAKGAVANMVVQLRRHNGEGFWALLSAQVFDYQTEASALTTFMDITDRIVAQEVVAKRATELQTVAKVSTTATTTLEPDRLLQAVVDLTKEQFGLYHAHIYLVNESWNTLLLAAGAGEVGRTMVADNWSIPLDHPNSIVAAAVQNKKSIIANDVHRDQDSSFLSNRLLPETRSEMAVPMIVGENVLGVFDVQSDLAGYFTEEDINIYTTLAAQVAIALQNARLYAEQASAMSQLRELDRLKSSFLANMSHELRTPLNSILGFTDVMLEGLDGSLTDYMDNDLRLIQKNGQHLLHLINDVLDMAKIESGRMNLHLETFKIHSALEEVTSITSTLASEKSLSLFIDENSDQEVEIYADSTRLRQVMINLVNNSIKFTQTGKISICAKPIDGARVLIAVKDSGVGIPPDQLEAVFQEFTQVDTSSTRKVGGTGLGLPISRRLVEMHGGRLWAESTGVEGEGSTFYVELPVEARVSEVLEKQEK